MRAQSVNPLPFRCGLEGMPFDPDYYPFLMPAQTVAGIWFRVKTWRVISTLRFEWGSLEFDVTLPRLASPNHERSLIDPRDFQGDGLHFLDAGTFGEPTRWQETIDQSDLVDTRQLTVTLDLCFIGERPAGVPLNGDTGPQERAFWSGTHLVRRRALAVPGMMRPSFCFSIAGLWNTGGSERTILIATHPIDQQEAVASATFDSIPYERLPFDLRISDSGGEPMTPLFGSTVEIVRHTHYVYENEAGTAVYQPDGTEILNPVKARIP